MYIYHNSLGYLTEKHCFGSSFNVINAAEHQDDNALKSGG